jgi:hypothetical protein
MQVACLCTKASSHPASSLDIPLAADNEKGATNPISPTTNIPPLG